MEKGNQQRNRKKQGDISKTKGFFLMAQEGWKKHKTGDANGDTKSRKRENKKHVYPEGRKTEQEKHVFKKEKQ